MLAPNRQHEIPSASSNWPYPQNGQVGPRLSLPDIDTHVNPNKHCYEVLAVKLTSRIPITLSVARSAMDGSDDG